MYICLVLELLGNMVILCLTLWATSRLFHSDYIILHSYQSCMKIPIFPQFHQHLLLVVFLIIVILVSMKWSLIVVLICVSQRNWFLFTYLKSQPLFSHELVQWWKPWGPVCEPWRFPGPQLCDVSESQLLWASVSPPDREGSL